MILDLDNCRLGESAEVLLTGDSAEVRAATLTLAQQAQRGACLFSRQLDDKLYNDRALHDALLSLAASSRQAQVRILVQDSTPVVKRGSRMIQLAHRLSSRVQIRKPPREYQNHTQEFFMVDEKGLMHRTLNSRYEGEVHFNDRLRCRQLSKFFDDCWERSAPDPELRSLVL